jgi:hypothetical protein
VTRVPREVLRDTISVEDYGGSSAHGPVYSSARRVRASLQPTTRLVNSSRGQVVAASALVIVRPEDGPVAVGSRVTLSGVVYRVEQVYAMPDSRRPSHLELVLSMYSTASST